VLEKQAWLSLTFPAEPSPGHLHLFVGNQMEPAMSPDLPIERGRARLFGLEAQRYDRFRPTYPGALFDEILGASPEHLSVLDVACGTGIASRPMATRGARVVGVELSPKMAEISVRHGIPTEVSSFESWDPTGRTFDVVTCAQAWHWLDPEVSASKAAAVLRPGGRLCLFWNVGRHPDALAERLDAVYRRVPPDGSPGLTIGYVANRAGPVADFGLVAEGLAPCGRFCAPDILSFPWRRTYTGRDWVEQLHSHSDHLALPADIRGELFREIGRAIDAFGGVFEMHYTTVLISARTTGP
jgi:SAM-dependent methyltransferase